MSTDRIEKKIRLRAPQSRVWQAISDATAFGSWFGVKFQGAFAPGAVVRGTFVDPQYAHLPMEVTIERIEPERLFSFRWFADVPDAGEDVSAGPMTLVEFALAEVPEGTELTIVESGFDRLPPERRARAWPSNDEGWTIQIANIERYVTGS
jgi:uncharacterized protein YndB with AHSA1/START domain